MAATQVKRLVINADDFGYCSNRNKGIVEAFCHRVVSSVSLLVNAASALEAISLARDHDIPMGLHLNLTEGQPIADGHTTLIDSKGYFRGKMGFRESLSSNEIDIYEIRTEIQAQLRWFKEKVGYNPTHIDGHQHIHVLPKVCETLASIMKENHVTKTRNPAEDLEGCHWIEPFKNTFLLSVTQDAKTACGIFERAGISFTGCFIGMSIMGSDMTVERIELALQKCFKSKKEFPAQASSTLSSACELMVHPGYRGVPGVGGCGEGPDAFSLSQDREHELDILSCQKLKTLLEKEHIVLCSFGDI